MTTPVQPQKELKFAQRASAYAADAEDTPEMPATATENVTVQLSDDVDYNLFIKETLLWTNRIRSGFWLVCGTLLWYTAYTILKSNLTLPTGVCYVLLVSLFFNFLRALMVPTIAARCLWAKSGLTEGVVALSAATLRAMAAVHDRHLNGRDPLHTLEVGLGLWVLSLVGRAVDGLSLLLALYLGAFTLPIAYQAAKPKVDAHLSAALDVVKAKYQGVSRNVKASVISVLLVVLAVVLPTFDRCVAIAILLVYGRAILRTHEVERINKHVTPLGKGLVQMQQRAAGIAADMAVKYELTPTPSKKKRM